MELVSKTFSCAAFYVRKSSSFWPILPSQLFAGGREDDAAVERVANFSQTYSFVYFEIFGIVEATYSENMKPICRFNQLCKFEAVYFSAYLFSIWTVRRGSFFHTFPIKISFDYIYLIKHLLDLKTLDTA